MSFSPAHIKNVRVLYKTCLKLHRGLPIDLKAIGDAYVKEEFKRHKSVEYEHAAVFMQAWANYALTLSNQLQAENAGKNEIGKSFGEKHLNYFSNEQLVQLYELYQETQKPVSD